MFESKIPVKSLKNQTIQEIIRYIRSMDSLNGNKLPREEEFCKIIGVSRATLRTALDEMEVYGIIFRKHGKGTFANPCSLDIKVSFNPVMDFYDMICLSGYTPSVQLLESYRQTVPDDLAELFRIPKGQTVMMIKKIFYADGRFCAYIEDILNISMLTEPALLDSCDLDTSILRLLEQKFKLQIEWDKVEIDTVLNRDVPAIATLIEQGKCENRALLLLRGMNYDTNGIPILFSKEYVDTSLISFSQIRKRQPAAWLKED